MFRCLPRIAMGAALLLLLRLLQSINGYLSCHRFIGQNMGVVVGGGSEANRFCAS